jgi:hypothetical protein
MVHKLGVVLICFLGCAHFVSAASYEAETILVSPTLGTSLNSTNNAYEIHTGWSVDSGSSLVIYSTESLYAADCPKLVISNLSANTEYNVRAWIVYAPSNSVSSVYSWKLRYSFISAAKAYLATAPYISNDSLSNPSGLPFSVNGENRYTMGTAISDSSGKVTIYLGRAVFGTSLNAAYIGCDSFEVTLADGNATDPVPADNANYIDQKINLRWIADSHAASHDVYIGTNYSDVFSAQPINLDVSKTGLIDIDDLLVFTNEWLCEAPAQCNSNFNKDSVVNFADFALLGESWLKPAVYQGRVQTNSYLASSLEPGVYYWRVDEVNDSNVLIGKGNVWKFTVGQYIVRPEDYGAVGDGVNNDANAFYAASKAIEVAGGGILQLTTGKIYYLNRQILNTDTGHLPYWKCVQSIEIANAHIRKVIIDGNGATLKLNDGLNAGAFDSNGVIYEPNYSTDNLAAKYCVTPGNLISISYCSDVEINDITLDGNFEMFRYGGNWPRTFYELNRPNYEIDSSGINLTGNQNVIITNVNTAYNMLDGIRTTYPEAATLCDEDPNKLHYFKNVHSTYNRRQGLSWCGGIGLTIEDSNFCYTGLYTNDDGDINSPDRNRPVVDLSQTKSKDFCNYYNAPAAGIDLEANTKCIRGSLIKCDFVNNMGYGLVASNSGNKNCYIKDCLIFGTTNHALGIGSKGYKFFDCNIYGEVDSLYGSTDANEATQFYNCTFEDVQNFTYANWSYSHVFDIQGLLNLGSGKKNVKFVECSFSANKTRPFYITDPCEIMLFENCEVYHNCDTNYAGSFQSVVRGTYWKNSTFHENLSTGNYYIKVQNTIVDVNVVVDGPQCKWQSLYGLTGMIPEGKY